MKTAAEFSGRGAQTASGSRACSVSSYLIRWTRTVSQVQQDAENNNYYLSYERGYDDWEQIAATPEYDIFSTSIVVSYDTPLPVHQRIATKTVELTRKYNRISQCWGDELLRVGSGLRFHEADRAGRSGIDLLVDLPGGPGNDPFGSRPEEGVGHAR